ncbi:hypothetical protein LCGC14_0547020 [marine sediment metagenome]|uniref:Uncharacterized protein n=1 Tax=marine sediment metagenome TaxID=412755 RepID=A0A0F9RR02_9ZZZZ
MTKKEAEHEFKARHRRVINLHELNQADGRWPVPKDKPMRSEAWNDFTDALCKEGRITMKQYETWTHPSWCN